MLYASYKPFKHATSKAAGPLHDHMLKLSSKCWKLHDHMYRRDWSEWSCLQSPGSYKRYLKIQSNNSYNQQNLMQKPCCGKLLKEITTEIVVHSASVPPGCSQLKLCYILPPCPQDAAIITVTEISILMTDLILFWMTGQRGFFYFLL